MPGERWRWVVAVLGLAGGLAGHAQQPQPAAVQPVIPVPPEMTTPLRDLTPPDLIPPPPESHHWYPETPGHLAPSVPHGHGLYVSAEALVLRPRRGAFDFVIPTTATGLATTGPVESLNYELRGGVRAELGYRFDGGWDVAAGYTYFRSTARGVVQAGPGQVLLPTLTRPGLTDQVLGAAADADLEYHVYDAVVGRRLLVDEHLALRVFGGLRFASIRQDFRALYDGLDARSAAVSVPTTFEGFGPVVGGEAVLAGWRGLHLYARASGGLLTGPANNPLTETNNGGRTVYVSSGYDVRKVVPVAGVGVGGGWQYRTVTIRAGYEVTNWFGLIDQPRLSDAVAPGALVTRPADLSLEGLFVQVALSF